MMKLLDIRFMYVLLCLGLWCAIGKGEEPKAASQPPDKYVLVDGKVQKLENKLKDLEQRLDKLEGKTPAKAPEPKSVVVGPTLTQPRIEYQFQNYSNLNGTCVGPNCQVPQQTQSRFRLFRR